MSAAGALAEAERRVCFDEWLSAHVPGAHQFSTKGDGFCLFHAASEHGRSTDGRNFEEIGQEVYKALLANKNIELHRDIVNEAIAVEKGDYAAMSEYSFYGLAYVMNVKTTVHLEDRDEPLVITTSAAAEFLSLSPKESEPLKSDMTLGVRIAHTTHTPVPSVFQ